MIFCGGSSIIKVSSKYWKLHNNGLAYVHVSVIFVLFVWAGMVFVFEEDAIVFYLLL
jgi:hypothetical protein